MQGNLKQVQLPEVLQFISMGKSTGTLTVRSRDFETTLMIRDGRIINSSSLDRQRRLGDLLVHRGILRRSVLAQVLNLQRTVESDKRVGEILVERDYVPENTIRDVLRLQLEEEIWNLFGLEEGEFRFEQVEDAKLGEATVQIDIEPLLLEGTRRQDEWRKITIRLTSDELVPTVVLDVTKLDEKLKLSSHEWKVLSQINGRFNIRAIINRATMGRFDVYRILDSFLTRKLVEVREPAAVIAGPAEPGETGSGQTAAKGGGVGGLLSRFKARPEKEDAVVFVSPVGALTHFINHFVDHVSHSKEFKGGERDGDIVARMWFDMLPTFTRADLMRARRNVLNCDSLEDYFERFEFSDAVMDCYEDTIEALFQLLDGLYRAFAQRVGERACSRAVREVLEDMKTRTSLKYPNDFKLDERVQMVLRLAA